MYVLQKKGIESSSIGITELQTSEHLTSFERLELKLPFTKSFSPKRREKEAPFPKTYWELKLG